MPTKEREIKVKSGVIETIPKPQTLFLQLKGSGDKVSINHGYEPQSKLLGIIPSALRDNFQ
jgi:hypothetical protein